ncbi:MAG: hypothetical protein RLY96_705 [Actinomycetota bacterium]
MSLSMGQQLLSSSPIKENDFASMRCCLGGAKRVVGGIESAMASIAPMIKHELERDEVTGQWIIRNV